MVRIHWPTLAAVGVVLLEIAIRAQQISLTPNTPSSGSPVPVIVQLRTRMKQLQDMQAQELAGEMKRGSERNP